MVCPGSDGGYTGKARHLYRTVLVGGGTVTQLAVAIASPGPDGAVALQGYRMGESGGNGNDAFKSRYRGGVRPIEPHPVPILWAVNPGQRYQIMDRKLACGREPTQIRPLFRRATHLPVSIFHLGWLDESNRARRHARYVEHDGGNFHARQHLDSIMWDDRRVRLSRRPWPASLTPEMLLRPSSALS